MAKRALDLDPASPAVSHSLAVQLYLMTERFSAEAQVVLTNVFNPNQWGDPTGDFLDTSNPAGWGTLPGSVTAGNQSYMRKMQFGIRLKF